MDLEEELSDPDVIPTMTISRSAQPLQIRTENIETEVGPPEVKSNRPRLGYEEGWRSTKKIGNGKPLRVKFHEEQETIEEYPEDQDQEDATIEDMTGQRSGRGRPNTKVVIRRLPPNMTREEFIEAVQPLPEYNYVSMFNPDKDWGFEARAVAHINFLDEDDARWFIERFTGYQFIDVKGDEYVSICGVAMHPGVPKPGKENVKKGTLEQSEHYREFLVRYDEAPFTVDGEAPAVDGEFVTPEMMLNELEERTTAKEGESTPLLEFLKSRKAASRKERDIKRQREKRSSEKRETSESKYRDAKRERKRDRRDKERRERREKDKLERDAKTKGLTITYSKSGKVTRWSTNSSPFPKKSDEEKAQGKLGKDEDGTEKLLAITEETQSKSSTALAKDKEKLAKADKTELKKKLFNPLQSKSRPSDGKKTESFDDKTRFIKPFPIKDDKKKEASSLNVEKPSSSTSQNSTKSKEAITPDKPSEESKVKKKIIKKIIKVRRVRPKTIEDGAEPNVEGETSEKKPSTSLFKKVSVSSVSKSKPDPNAKSKENAKPKSADEMKLKEDRNAKSEEKSQSDIKKSSEDSNPSGSKQSTSKVEDEHAKRRRARPDMQIYRPGARLRSAGGSKLSSTSDSKAPSDIGAKDS